MNCKKSILLIGMPGCGKTTIGKVLAREINYSFYDMDKYIEETSGSTIPELFNISEEHFRALESKACVELSKKSRSIISSGGGVVKNKKNVDLFKEESIIIFIDRDIEDIIGDVEISGRPLLKDGVENLYKLYKERYELYNQYCHIKVKNKGFLKDVINEVARVIRIEFNCVKKTQKVDSL